MITANSLVRTGKIIYCFPEGWRQGHPQIMEEKKGLPIDISKYARNKVIEQLKNAFIEDMLEQDDFENRLAIATTTRNKADLQRLVEDLPEIRHPYGTQTADSSIEAENKMVTILGEVKRKGVWKPAGSLEVQTTLGETVLDFTEAILIEKVTIINLKCVLGEIRLIVPAGVKVEGHCKAVLGSFEDRSLHCEDPDAPVIRIRGSVCLGSIDIRSPKVSIITGILKKLGLDPHNSSL